MATRGTPCSRPAMRAPARSVGAPRPRRGGIRGAIFGPSESEKKAVFQAKQLESELETVHARLKEITKANVDLEKELEKANDLAEMRGRRLREAEKEVFKLERALEEKESTLESFAATARRQIAALEQRLKEEKE